VPGLLVLGDMGSEARPEQDATSAVMRGAELEVVFDAREDLVAAPALPIACELVDKLRCCPWKRRSESRPVMLVEAAGWYYATVRR
jgi:hypothetical protein